MQKGSFFPYSWHTEDDQEEFTRIRIYGVNEQDENVCVTIDDFTPWVYIELPTNINWTGSKAQILGNKIDDMLGRQKPVKKVLVYKQKLYGANIDPDTGKQKLFPYLFCSFYNSKDVSVLGWRLKGALRVTGLGSLKLKIHESDANPILQLTCCRKLSTAGWIQFQGRKVREVEKETLCHHEFDVKSKYLEPMESDMVPRPKIMAFDIEVNSSNPEMMPQSKKTKDKVFQISCILTRDVGNPESYDKYLLSLGDPDEKIVGYDTIVYTYDTEAELLVGFKDFICEENPNIIAGYNILGFDIDYMIDRSKSPACCYREFSTQGFHARAQAKEKTIKWSSSAYKNQEFKFLDAQGRLFVDLLPLVQRDFKFSSYNLKTISTYFLGQTKDPLTPKGIFKCYRIGTTRNSEGEYSKKARKAIAVVGKYCVQDSLLVLRLMDKLKTCVGLTEMASTCNVPIFTLYTQGQQIKVYSQIYRYCMYQNIVVEKDGYQVTDNERYVGAKVFPPIPGKYKDVCPLDFASLYPTILEAHNISPDTNVPDDSSIPDHKCHVMEWEDHIACEHDPKVKRKMILTTYLADERAKISKMRETKKKCSIKLTEELVGLDRSVVRKLVTKRQKEIQEDINKAVNELKPYAHERSELTKTISKYPMCAKRRYRFLKEPKGVIPTVIRNLLEARKNTRKVDMAKVSSEIERLEKEEPDNSDAISVQKSLLDILDKRQLAFKVSANSMYGAMGVRKGYLPFMPGAMCTTYIGRKNITIVAKEITETYQGKLVYGDTDSNYVQFPHLKTVAETWDHAVEVADKISQLFPPPIRLEFEEEIYSFFLILSKKRYMYRKCLRDGVVDKKIGSKGVLLARRDNSKFVRDVYENVVTMIADQKNSSEVLDFVIGQINQLCSGCKPYTDFIITKAVGDHGGLIAQKAKNEKGATIGKVGDFTVPLLSRDVDECKTQLEKKGATTPQDFYLLCLPAQVQLAERMRKRGKRVDVGTRLEYVVTDPERHTAKQYEKIESVEYMYRHRDIIRIDYMYYLNALVNPLDQVLDVAFKDEEKFKAGFVVGQYNYRWKVRAKLLQEIRKLSEPKLVFIEETDD